MRCAKILMKQSKYDELYATYEKALIHLSPNDPVYEVKKKKKEKKEKKERKERTKEERKKNKCF